MDIPPLSSASSSSGARSDLLPPPSDRLTLSLRRAQVAKNQPLTQTLVVSLDISEIDEPQFRALNAAVHIFRRMWKHHDPQHIGL